MVTACGAVVLAGVVGAACATGAGIAPRGTSSPPSTASPSTAPAATTTTGPSYAAGWGVVPPGPVNPGSVAAWTGTQLLVDEGECCAGLGSTDIDAYDPATRTWTALPTSPLSARQGALGVWTGTELVVVGGTGLPAGSSAVPDVQNAVPLANGAAYHPATRTWTPIAPAPTALEGSAWSGDRAVWSGSEVLVWAPAAGTAHVYAYAPATDRWRTIPLGPAPELASSLASAEPDAVVLWTGTGLLVWPGPGTPSGGATTSTSVPPATSVQGAILDPATGTWRAMAPAPIPARNQASAVWTGTDLFVWGGAVPTATGSGAVTPRADGALYDPSTLQWRTLPPSPLTARSGAAAVWTGREVVVLGGEGVATTSTSPDDGFALGSAVYVPASDTWQLLPASPVAPVTDNDVAPAEHVDLRIEAVGFWTGSQALFTGGEVPGLQAAGSSGATWTPGI
jgi:hypothetical protein